MGVFIFIFIFIIFLTGRCCRRVFGWARCRGVMSGPAKRDPGTVVGTTTAFAADSGHGTRQPTRVAAAGFEVEFFR